MQCLPLAYSSPRDLMTSCPPPLLSSPLAGEGARPALDLQPDHVEAVGEGLQLDLPLRAPHQHVRAYT